MDDPPFIHNTTVFVLLVPAYVCLGTTAYQEASSDKDKTDIRYAVWS